jgi:alcohol/geraniol dehydrogenase (NADP+)
LLILGTLQLWRKCANCFDVIISTVSADLDWPRYLNALKPKGKLCIVGAPASDIRVPAFPGILGRKSVFGTPVGGPCLIREMLEFAERNGIELITECLPMSQADEALECVRRNKARYRMVLVN